MKWKVPVIALIALAVTVLSAQIDEVIAARNAFSETGATGDKLARAALLADDLTWVDRGGRLRNKQAELAEFMLGGTTRATEADARRYGTVAVLLNRLSTTDNNSVISIGVWQKSQKGWVLLAIQNTQVGGVPPNPDLRASSPLPGNTGSAADTRAIRALTSELEAASRSGNAGAFVGGVTQQFLSVSASGQVRTADERSTEIKSGVAVSDTLLPREAESTRVYGDFALTNQQRAAKRRRPSVSPPGIDGQADGWLAESCRDYDASCCWSEVMCRSAT